MISIIIATFNSELTLQRCLDSIFKQSYTSYEILVKDGGSKDNTIKVLENNAQKIDYICTGEDDGVYDAWNHCLKIISGEWFIFLGSDDYLEDVNFLNRMLAYFIIANNQNSKIIYGKNKIITVDGNFIAIVGDNWEISKKKINSVMTIRHPGCFHHKSLLELVGFFDTKFKIVGDHHYILRSLKFGEPIFYPFVGVVHSLGGISTNPSLINKLIRETYKLRHDLMLKPFILIDMHFLKRVIISIILFFFGEKNGSYLVRYFIFLKNKKNGYR